jgi:hypothetical protein
MVQQPTVPLHVVPFNPLLQIIQQPTLQVLRACDDRGVKSCKQAASAAAAAHILKIVTRCKHTTILTCIFIQHNDF